ncbi:MAG TPA: beta-propeller domain-containing protein [Pyrinomonadaceae bacterium]|jgi:hypothetical protein
MKSLILFVVAAAFAASNNASCAGGMPFSRATPVQTNSFQKFPRKTKTMRAFGSQQELAKFFRRLAEEQRRDEQRAAKTTAPATQVVANADTAAAPAKPASDKDEESVTNVQHAGVDEGGIVKLHGDHLVVLRRGRLFTVAIGDGALKPVSMVDAFAPDIDPGGAWYDEMLISGDTIAVIGYSYQRGGTEIGLFHIERDGTLRYRSTYHLRSNDYYSSRNYASRLIGDKLIFYTPLYLSPGDQDPQQGFPALRKWHKGAKENEFRRIVAPTRVYRPERRISASYGLALHTVTVCDLARGDMTCEGTAVVGPPGRVFYVSPESVYVWVSDWIYEQNQAHTRSMLYRMPLDGSAPSALGVSGSPVDQFSFLESADEHLNVLVQSEARSDAMWGAEVAPGEVAMMRVSLGSFSDGSTDAPNESYRRLPKPQGYTFQNRFVGDYVLYGTGSGWGQPEQAKRVSLYATRWADDEGEAVELTLAHGVDRIEALGSDAVVVGTDGQDLHFSAVRLGERPSVAHRYTRKGASQGELRSHGFFYKPDGTDSGLLGLPIHGAGRPGYEHLFNGSASILFLRNDSLHFNEIGELRARPEKSLNDACRASCVDWYGNARPLFVRGRVFALLGYEIVEGTLAQGHILETRRISYAGRHLKTARR